MSLGDLSYIKNKICNFLLYHFIDSAGLVSECLGLPVLLKKGLHLKKGKPWMSFPVEDKNKNKKTGRNLELNLLSFYHNVFRHECSHIMLIQWLLLLTRNRVLVFALYQLEADRLEHMLRKR